MMLKPRNNISTLLPVLIALLAGALPFQAAASQAIAQSTELQSAVNDVSESVTRLGETQDVRPTLLKILELTRAEIKDLSSKDRLIQAVTDKDAEIAALAKRHLTTLKSNGIYINGLKEQVSDESVELSGLQSVADDFKLWREAYDTQTKETLDLLLFLQARAVLGTVGSRLSLIVTDVKKLAAVASKADADSLNRLLNSARKNLQTARANQDAARTALLEDRDEKKAAARDILHKKLEEEFALILQTYNKIFLPMSKIAQQY